MFARTRQGAIDVIASDEAFTSDRLPAVTKLLEECVREGQPRVVIDLAKVPLMDSAGLEMLLDFQESFQQRGGAVKLSAPNQLCRDILTATGVDSHFEVFADCLAAVGSFAR